MYLLKMSKSMSKNTEDETLSVGIQVRTTVIITLCTLFILSSIGPNILIF